MHEESEICCRHKTDAIDSLEALAAADKQLIVDNGCVFESYAEPEMVQTYGQRIDALLAYGTTSYSEDDETYASTIISYYIDCGDQFLEICVYGGEGYYYENSFCGYIMGLHEAA